MQKIWNQRADWNEISETQWIYFLKPIDNYKQHVLKSNYNEMSLFHFFKLSSLTVEEVNRRPDG